MKVRIRKEYLHYCCGVSNINNEIYELDRDNLPENQYIPIKLNTGCMKRPNSITFMIKSNKLEIVDQ